MVLRLKILTTRLPIRRLDTNIAIHLTSAQESVEETQPSTSITDPKNTNNPNEDMTHLDEEILTLLSDAPKELSPISLDIHIDGA